MTPASEKVTHLPEVKKAKHLKLYLRVTRDENEYIAPSDDITFYVEHFTDESMMTDKWHVLRDEMFSMICRSDLGEISLNTHLHYLHNQGYEWTWVVEKRIDWMLLKHYYNKDEISVDLGEFTL